MTINISSKKRIFFEEIKNKALKSYKDEFKKISKNRGRTPFIDIHSSNITNKQKLLLSKILMLRDMVAFNRVNNRVKYNNKWNSIRNDIAHDLENIAKKNLSRKKQKK
jgi:predicted molibdopterin-dependent oxidoreductase YjgC